MGISKTYLVVIIIFSCLTLTAQNTRKSERLTNKADEAIKERKFDKAVELLYKAIEADQTYGNAYLKLAGIYNIFQKQDSALLYYNQYVAVVPEREINERLWLRVAELNYLAGDYQRAKYAIDRMQDSPPFLRQSIEFSLASIANKKELEIEELPEAINQYQLQYFPALTVDEKVIIYTKRDSNSPSSDEDIVVSSQINGTWIPAQSISKVINSRYNEGASTISADGKTLIFAACEGRTTFGSCDLFITYREGNQWSEPENLGPRVNSQYWDSQPSLSADGRTLYFVSNRPKGIGKRDIWVSRYDGKEWKEPENLNINTPYDDTTPFIHANNSLLFFSSEGYPGLGGFDLFVTSIAGTEGTRPRNLGYPINTHHDELSLFVNASGTTGYFAKERNRDGSIYESKIVKFKIPADTLVPEKTSYVTGRVLDAKTNHPIGTTLKMVNLNDTTDTYYGRADSVTGRYFLVLTEGREYGVFINKENYLFEDLNFLSRESTALQPDTLDIYLRPIEKGDMIVLKNIYFDFDKYTLDSRSLSELHEVVYFLQQNSRLQFEIQGHTDNVGDHHYNQELSERRAQTIYDFLISRGIDKTRMSYKGFGSSKPMESNASEEGRHRNRRIVFKVLSNQ